MLDGAEQVCILDVVMNYILQFKADRLTFIDSFRVDAYEDELKDIDAHAKRIEGSDKAIEWLFDSLGDKSINDAWNMAARKASQANRGLTYSNFNRGKNASKYEFWKNIEEFMVWLTTKGFNNRRNITLAQVHTELTK
jgi:hypothetical protein